MIHYFMFVNLTTYEGSQKVRFHIFYLEYKQVTVTYMQSTFRCVTYCNFLLFQLKNQGILLSNFPRTFFCLHVNAINFTLPYTVTKLRWSRILKSVDGVLYLHLTFASFSQVFSLESPLAH
jgi:hypothetical protein